MYVIDTLRDRLQVGGTKAYIIRFDEDSKIFKMVIGLQKERRFRELISSGEYCCKDFFTYF